MPKTTAPTIPVGDKEFKTVHLRVGDLQRDPRVNPRTPSDSWIAARSGAAFSWPKIGTLAVSYRNGDDGRPAGKYVLDGWNRRMLILKNFSADQEAECRVYPHLTAEDEARIFLGLNDNRRVDAVSKFLAGVTAGDIPLVEITQIAAAATTLVQGERAGFTIGKERDPGVLVCVQELSVLHRRDKQKCGTKREPQALKRTLECIQTAWRPSDPQWYARNTDATHRAVIGGVGAIFYAYGDAVDVTRMSRVLAEFPGGPNTLVQQANGIKGSSPGVRTLAQGVTHIVVREYNKGKRGANTLPLTT
jgi:hypothetical protein